MDNTQTSPFAAPAQAQSAPPSASPASNPGDTSFYDQLPSHEPLVKACQVPAEITAFEVKSSEAGKPFISIAVQLYGENMKLTNGDPVPKGKRLQQTFFLSAGDMTKFARVGRSTKNLLLALRNIPLTSKGKDEMDAYAKLPPQAKLANPTLQPDGSVIQNPSAFLSDNWVGTKVIADVREGRDMDKQPRNEFALLAASTPVKAAK